MVKSNNRLKLPPLERLRSILSYDPVTGDLTWKVNRRNVTAGSKAGYKRPSGYIYVRIDGRDYPAHRVAFALGHGVIEFGHLDHINGNRSDNRLTNLREVTSQENNRNCRVRSDNTSSYKGVDFRRARGLYRARIKLNCREIHLGYFTSPKEAALAYDAAALKYFGEFAKTNADMGLL